jgi:hypothetical protein
LSKKKPKENSSKYSASFTAGGLLYDETIALLPLLNDNDLDLLDDQLGDNSVLQINSLSARKRVLFEIKKRYHLVGGDVFKSLNSANPTEQKIILLYICAKSYSIIFDFLIDVIIEKWLTRDLAISTAMVDQFLEKQSEKHPEIEEWTESTKYKISSVAVKMLKDSGLLINGQLTAVEASDEFWRQFVLYGDNWFLQTCLLNKKQREQVINV